MADRPAPGDQTHDPAAAPAEGSARFYADLEAFADFGGFSDLRSYTALPDDWTVLASDVVGSTEAIDAGKYKQVNMAGAATIMAVLNAIGDVDAPYVFGGDGALIAVPSAVAPAATDAMARTAGMVRTVFDLTLRVSAFPAAALRDLGGDVRVRKFALGRSARLAMFAGDGVQLAEALLKDPDAGAPFRLEPSDEPADVEGLSCRWEPLKPTKGVMVTVMAQCVRADAAGEDLAALRHRMQAVLGGDETGSAPASDQSLMFRWPPSGLKFEALARAGRRQFWTTYLPLLLQSLAQGWAQKFRRKIGGYDAPAYRREMIAQTDFRKFDGLLRMVLDVTPATADAMEAMLQSEHRAGRVAYGMHRADAALMTCLVFDLAAADHVHFIDGANGGFALAARQFKQQLTALA